MIVFRLSRKKYKDDISGKGAELAGGRWNSTGVALLYTSGNRALCTAEIAVHTPLGITPKDYFLLTLKIPKTKAEEIHRKDLPKNWATFPHQKFTKKIGNNFVNENKNLILKVPSAVIQGEHNYLINPYHPSFKKVKIIDSEPFKFDMRLFEK